MMFRFALVFVAALLGPSAALANLSDIQCDDSARLKQQLADGLGVIRQGSGLRGPDAVLELWMHPANGDWTLVQTYANGTSCIVAMGEHWEDPDTSADPA